MKFFSLYTIPYHSIFFFICSIHITCAIYRLKINNPAYVDQLNKSALSYLNSDTKQQYGHKLDANNVSSLKPDSSQKSFEKEKFLNFLKYFKPNSENEVNAETSSFEVSQNYGENQKSSLLDETVDLIYDNIIYYPLNTTFFKIVTIPARTASKIIITSIDYELTDFLVVQAHSQKNQIALSFDRQPKREDVVNNTNVGLIVFTKKYEKILDIDKNVYAMNYHEQDLSILLLVRNYTDKEPIPGGLLANHSLSHPFLLVKQNLLTTLISFPLAAFSNISYIGSLISTRESVSVVPIPLTPTSSIKYEVFLTYMYEGDLFEEHLFQTIIKTSTVEGLKDNATKVAEINDYHFSNEWINELFVSYSGVGSVVNVLASFNGSEGVLYSSTVFYGCDFIEGEKYDCTKLVSSFAKLFCASLLFIGLILLFFGHRWLNFTMFISGFLASWFILFIIFVQIPKPDIEVLGFFTFLGAVLGGIGWLVLWHKYHRPFYSALLLILINSFFAAMILTHFLKYAVVPTHKNLAAFVIMPIAFSVAIIGYSIFNIKNVHIFSCCLLGSYGVVMPFAFYFGSSLTYIVINVMSAMSVRKFSNAVGFPPFQYCDIVILCVWIGLFILGIGYQVYRERSGPPFYPPNASVFKAVLSALVLFKSKLLQCSSCRQRADDDSLFEDRPYSLARLCSCYQDESSAERISAYESFPRIGSDDDEFSFKEAVLRPFRNGFGYLQQILARSRQRMENGSVREEQEDVQPLENEDANKETEFEDDPLRI